MSNEMSGSEKAFLWTLGIACGTVVLLAYAGGGGRKHWSTLMDAVKESLDAIQKPPATETKDVH